MLNLPSIILRACTVNSGAPAAPDGPSDTSAETFLPLGCCPTLEKFHRPEAERNKATCGFCSAIERMCTVREKISGMRSIPTSSDWARTNGAALKAGSSLTEMSAAFRLPRRADKSRCPIVISRPSMALNSF
jgi:hypothetical protein